MIGAKEKKEVLVGCRLKKLFPDLAAHGLENPTSNIHAFGSTESR
jgi:hypothetical protein